MGFSVQSIEYMLNGAAQDSGASRALGETGGNHYWTRIKVKTDASGCSSVKLSFDANCNDGAKPNVPYGEGAQLTASASATPSSYVGGTANITGTYLGNNQDYWRFAGTVSVSLKANTTYYLFLRPCWTTTDYFVLHVTGALSVSSAAAWPSYGLSISTGTGSSATVRRTASELGAATGALSDGATVYRGDTIAVGFGASTGYELSTHTVNGTARASGYSFSVSGDVAVKATAAKKTYKLSISAGTGAGVTVKRGATTLSDGATITHGDELSVTFEASTGYDLATHTVNGTTRASGYSFSVSGAVSVKATARLKTFTLSISAGTGAVVSVKRGSTALSNGDAVTYGEKLTVTFSATTGYKLTSHTVNGSSFTSGNSVTVSGALSVAAAAQVLSYTLAVSAGTGSSVTVQRTASPKQGAATGTLSNGAAVYYGDKLTISFAASTGYELKTRTVNDAAFTSGQSHTVTGAVSVKAAAGVKSFALSISPATGTTITVQRTSSPKQGASTGTLADGAKIYYSDVLKVSFAAKTGYVLDGGTVNGSSFTSGGSHTVTKAVAVKTTGHAGPSTISACPSSVQTNAALALSVSRVSTAYYHKARFLIGSTQLGVSGAFAKDLSYTVPREWFASYPSSTSLTVTVSVQTYTSSECTTAVGSPATRTVTVTADSGMKPVIQSGFAAVAADNSDISWSGSGTLSVYVQGYSKAAVTLTKSKLTMVSGATVASYKLSCQGKTQTVTSPGATARITTAALTGTAAIPITVTVTDSRGRTASTTLSVTPLAYAAPTLSGVKVFRCSSGGTALDGGAWYSAKATAACSTLGGINRVTLTVERRSVGGSWSDPLTLGSNAATVSVENRILGGGTLEQDTSYSIRLTATDSLGHSTTTTLTLPGLRWAIKFRPKGLGVAFGKAAENNKRLELPEDWELYFGTTSLPGRVRQAIAARGTVIDTSEVSDLNDLLTVGDYSVVNAEAAAAISNGPTSTAGYRLLVLAAANGSYRTQLAVVTNTMNPTVWLRGYIPGSGWSAWRRLAHTTELSYQAGDSVSFGTGSYAQFAGGFRSGTVLLFTIPLDKPVASGVTISVSGQVVLYKGDQYWTLTLGSGNTVSVYRSAAGIAARVVFSTAPEYSSSNSWIGIQAYGLTVSFT